MANNYSIIFIPKNFGMIDAYSPVIAEIGENNSMSVNQDTVFRSRIVFEDYQNSDFHIELLEQYSSVHKFFSSNKKLKRLFSYFYLLRLVYLILKRRLTSNSVKIIYNEKRKSKEFAFISQFCSMIKVSVLSFPSTQGITNERYAERFLDEAWSSYIEFGAKNRQRIISNGPTFGICYTQSETALLNITDYKCTKFLPIGIPRLYPSWKKHIIKYEHSILQKEFDLKGISRSAPKIITVILTNPRYFWFNEETSFEKLIEITIHTIRRHFPNIPIFLKIKLSMRWIFKDIVSAQEENGVFLTNCALSVLSLRSAFAVSIHESSGAFDLLFNNVPVVEISDYSKEWKELFPYLSPWKDVPGYSLATSEQEFDSFVQSYKNGTLKELSRDEFVSYFGHKNSLWEVLDTPAP